MANKKYMKTKPIRLFDQMIALMAAYPTSKCEIRKKILWWFGKIRPTPLSKEYQVLMTFELWHTPAVWIFGDNLEGLDNPDFPHKYHIDSKAKLVKICLYRYREFSSYMFLSKTIIPWIVEWLYYYEIWLATGEWFGGGEHPNIEGQKSDDNKDVPPLDML